MNQKSSDLRSVWIKAKASISESEKEKIEAFKKLNNMQISYISFFIVQCAMNSQKLKGYPYIDAKTFSGWKEEGKIVKKGQKHFCTSITWVPSNKKDDDSDDTFMYPKGYFLFHRSQVEDIK